MFIMKPSDAQTFYSKAIDLLNNILFKDTKKFLTAYLNGKLISIYF